MPRRRRPPRAGALSEFQPLKIAAQIAVLQIAFYTVALVLILFTALVAGQPFGADLILGWEPVRGDTTRGWVLAFVWVLNGGLCMALAIVAIVARSKLVPDFALTIHFLHLIATTLYSHSAPRNAMWWLTMLTSSGVCVAVGMWGCQYRELQPVFFGGGRILGSNAAPTTASSRAGGSPDDDDDDEGLGNGAVRGGDEEMGLANGKRRKNSGGGGEESYEMGKLKSSH